MFHIAYFANLLIVCLFTKVHSTNYHCSELQNYNISIVFCDGSREESTCSTTLHSGLFVSDRPLSKKNQNDTISVGNDLKLYSIWKLTINGEQILHDYQRKEPLKLDVAARQGTTVTINQEMVSCSNVSWKSALYTIDVKPSLQNENTTAIDNSMGEKTVVWKQGDYHIWWSRGCSFRGYTYATIYDIDLESCIRSCARDNKCLDFSLNDGICSLQNGPFNLTTTVTNNSLLCVPNAHCGWKETHIIEPMPRWKGGEDGAWWSKNCSWKNYGVVIEQIKNRGWHCGAECRKKDGCTHFYHGGRSGDTCNLLKEVNGIYPELSNIGMCGYLDRGQNGQQGRGSSQCV